jgi:Fe-S cluster assembly iron-binding protein IscA
MNINITNKALDEINKIIKGKNLTSKKIRIFLAGIG